MTTPLVVAAAPLRSPAARDLIARLDAELSSLYPEPGANHFGLDEAEVSPGQGVFLVAWIEGVPVGCGAMRLVGGAEAELKRMYVLPTHRGQGIGRAILARLEDEARRLGAVRSLLETGPRQTEALALYAAAGYGRVAPFGEYVRSPLSVCMAKDL